MNNLISHRTDLALFLVRFAVGASFISHGIMHLGDFGTTISLFSILGLSPLWAQIVTILEIICGVFFVAGVFVEWVAIILTMIMLVAVILISIIKGDSSFFELNLILLFCSLAIAFGGSGGYSITRFFPRRSL